MCITYLSRDSCRNLICKNLGQYNPFHEGQGYYLRMYRSLQELCAVNGQNRAAFVDNKRNMRKCNCHASVTLIGSILSLVIILRITTKS